MATAGAGPSSAIASTSPRNEPEIRNRFASSVRKSLPTDEHGEQADEPGRLPLLEASE